MFEQILASKKNPDSQVLAVGKPRSYVPPLGPIVIKPSRWLWHAQLMANCVLGILFILALAPLIAQSIIWLALLSIAMGCLLTNLIVQRKALNQPSKVLSYGTRGWLLTEPDSERSVRLVGETVVWYWLVILRLKDNVNASIVTVVLLPDSASGESLRALRVWLRTQVGRNPA